MSTLLVKNYASDVKKDTLFGVFSKFGAIQNCNVVENEEGSLNSHCYITFTEKESAEAAIQHFNGKDVLGATNLYVGFAKVKGGQDCYGPGNIFIRNLDYEIDEESLEKQFSIFGKIVSMKILKDMTGDSERRAFICFESVDDAILAIAVMNNKIIGSKTIIVEFSKCRSKKDKEIREKHIQNLKVQLCDTVKNEVQLCDTQAEKCNEASISKGKDRKFSNWRQRSNQNSEGKTKNKINIRKYKRIPRKNSYASRDSSSDNDFACATIQSDCSSESESSSVDSSYATKEKSSNKYKSELFSDVFDELSEEEQKKLLFQLLLPQTERLYPDKGEQILKNLIFMKNCELIKMFEDSTLLKARCDGIANVIKLKSTKIFKYKTNLDFPKA